jgi:hypothetical protein
VADWTRGALGIAALVLAGCSGALTVHGEVVQPARMPVRAFPHILVTADDTDEARTVADAVARHLSGGRSRVQRLAPREVRALRAATRLPRASVVVRIGVELARHDRPQWARRRELDCGPLGCLESRRAYVRDTPVVVGHLVVTVVDGPSGRALQREELSEEESGVDVLGMRLRVLERLSERTRELVDQRAEAVAVELHPVDHPEVRAALEAIRGGDWSAGRRRLERLIASDAFSALPRRDRALVLYDLGQCRRFDSSLPAERRFDAAAEALRAAVNLVPEPRFAVALGELRAHRRSRDLVLEQHAAMAHNFRLARGEDADVPEPPSHYE